MAAHFEVELDTTAPQVELQARLDGRQLSVLYSASEPCSVEAWFTPQDGQALELSEEGETLVALLPEDGIAGVLTVQARDEVWNSTVVTLHLPTEPVSRTLPSIPGGTVSSPSGGVVLHPDAGRAS